jgi:hypothetical protein
VQHYLEADNDFEKDSVTHSEAEELRPIAIGHLRGRGNSIQNLNHHWALTRLPNHALHLYTDGSEGDAWLNVFLDVKRLQDKSENPADERLFLAECVSQPIRKTMSE